MAIRLSNPVPQHFDKGTNAPLSGGQMFFFEPGSTVTPKDTFTDDTEATANANPVILDANGKEPSIFGNGSYNVVLRAAPISPATVGVQQWARDPVQFTTEAGIGFSDWDSGVTYSISDIVRGSDSLFYVSITDSNTNNDPTDPSPDDWTQFLLLKIWNTLEQYLTGDVVISPEGKRYTAVQSTIGENPDNDSDSSDWEMFDNIRITGNTISSTDTNGDINLDPNGTGELLTNGELIGLAPVSRQIFNVGTSQTWTRPANVKFIIIDMQGAGGGGGPSGTPNEFSAGQGGGAGARILHVTDVTSTASLTLTVAAGAAGGTGDSTGGTGAPSTVLSTPEGTLTAGGGLGGNAGGSLANIDNGGVGFGNGQNFTGNSGTSGNFGLSSADPAGGPQGGPGGASIYGGVQAQVVNFSGNNALSPGSGGNGGGSPASTSFDGGDGADGIIIITEYR